MPIVAIQIIREGTSPEQKAALVKGATYVLNKSPTLTFVVNAAEHGSLAAARSPG